MTTCIFCKIVTGELPAKIVYQNERVMAFNDINPQAKTHILVIPKKHIDSVITLKKEEGDEVKELIFGAQQIAKEKGLEGYRLNFHCGAKGGQIIFHLHLHLLANE